jgi:hypothetical protein
MNARNFFLFLIAASAAACSGDSGGAGGATPTPVPAGLPGVYAGDFPCSNCAAIAATLWLRSDNRFFLRQSYAGNDGTLDGVSTYAVGRWHWDEVAALVVLVGAGPDRRLEPLDAGQLRLLTASKVAHVLTLDPASPAFTDRLRLDGESAIVDGNAEFIECLTGLQFAVAKEGAYGELRRQHRRLNPRGRVTRTALEGRIVTRAAQDSANETLLVERVIDLKPGVGC